MKTGFPVSSGEPDFPKSGTDEQKNSKPSNENRTFPGLAKKIVGGPVQTSTYCFNAALEKMYSGIS